MAAAAFYAHVFGWQTEAADSGDARFADGSGHVIGHFQADMTAAGESGVRPYVYVDDLEGTLARVVEAGGEVATAPYAEGDLRVATFLDAAGNVLGVWHRPA
jgi:predicted enzyme related to lactoylglutathione lyase